jgi:hypothetical protein
MIGRPKVKYLIAPTMAIGNYWARQMGLASREYRIVIRQDQIMGIRAPEEDFVFIRGEEYDYPELHDRERTNSFYELCRYIETITIPRYKKNN